MKTTEETLAPRPRNATNRVPMVVTYHLTLPNIGSIVRELQPLLHRSEKCNKAIKDVPFMAFRRPKSLGDYLVHAKLRPSTRLERSSKGTVVCGNRRCQVCKYLEPGERFTSYRTGKSYTINYELDCNSSNIGRGFKSRSRQFLEFHHLCSFISFTGFSSFVVYICIY